MNTISNPATNTEVASKNSLGIQVTNSSSTNIQVAINQWGSGGDTSPYTLKPGDSGNWGRTDSRGDVLAFIGASGAAKYYVVPGADVVFSDSRVTGATKIPT